MCSLNPSGKELGEIIRKRRKAAKLTQAEVARRMGKDRQCIQRIETGNHDIKYSTLSSISDALQIPVYMLVNLQSL